jgi:squalene-hopene/tetraprenyl-beta-curcumene cyclase
MPTSFTNIVESIRSLRNVGVRFSASLPQRNPSQAANSIPAKRSPLLPKSAIAVCLAAATFAIIFTTPAKNKSLTKADLAPSWNRTAAAKYLDDRQAWWMNWHESARDHETFCVSCHTVMPYALGRPALRSALGESAPSPNEQKLLQNVTKRVQLWNEMAPFYSDEKVGPHKTPQSRGTESILNALILATYESHNAAPSPTLSKALQNMWGEQQKSGEQKGGWFWLNFHTQPWEADSSPYYGATLAAVAAGTAPGDYRATPVIQKNLDALRTFLRNNYQSQSLNNRTFLLWASAKIPGILRPTEQRAIIENIIAAQQQDGGWSLTPLVGPWKRGDGTPLETKSDGYATGVVSFVLQQAGISPQDDHLHKGLAWLATHQDPSQGLWPAYSLNKQRTPAADAWLFMSDAATGYSVLALTQAQTN